MKIGLLVIGPEIPGCSPAEKNVEIIGTALAGAGFSVAEKISAGDCLNDISRALEYLGSDDLIIITSGQGPVPDFLTETAERFAKKKKSPGNAVIIEDAKMDKPPFIIEGGITFAVIPGNGSEILPALRELVKYINECTPGGGTKSVIVKMTGIARQAVEDHIRKAAGNKIDFETAECPGEVVLRLHIEASGYPEALQKAESFIAGIDEVRKKTYSYEASAALQDKVIEGLIAGGRTISAAESCTGGLFTKMLTEVPGSSGAVLGSVVSYDNSVKTGLIGVGGKILTMYGAVSFECAEAMIRGLRNTVPADYIVSITGIAGPSGGTKEKPVGTVFIGLGRKDAIYLFRFAFKGSREEIRICSAMKALELVWEDLTYGTIDPYDRYGAAEILIAGP